MPETAIAVQPASSPAGASTASVKVFSTIDEGGRPVLVQAMCLVDENGKPYKPMSEETGQNLLMAIKALHACIANFNGDLLPSTSGLSPT